MPSLPDDAKDIQTSTISNPESTEDRLDILPAFQVEDLEARFAEMVIGTKKIAPFRHTTDNLRMMIDLDESDNDGNDDDDGQDVDSDLRNETLPVEPPNSGASKPTLANFKPTPPKRSQTLEMHLTRFKPMSGAIKIVFRNDTKSSSWSPPLPVKGKTGFSKTIIPAVCSCFQLKEQSVPEDSVGTLELEKLAKVAPLSNMTNQTYVESSRDKCLSNEPPSARRVTPNRRLEVENQEPPQEPRSFRRLHIEKREPPREPRALRGL